MVRKLIAFSFEPESIGGFAVVCNGVHFGRNGAFSHFYPLTKAAFVEAMKDRIKFNDILGIDIRDGWQNALKDAIEPFSTMTEDADPAVVADAVAKADINIRGEEEVAKDVEVLEVENEKLVAEVEKEVIEEKPAKKTRKTTKKAQKEVENDDKREEVVADSVENAGSEPDSGISAEGTSTADNA
jgi:hypothetical protein